MQAAIWQDVFEAFPEADGGLMDGWTESAYELIFHHGNAVFREFSEADRSKAGVRGYDVDRLERGMTRLRDRFHSLTPSRVRYWGGRGLLAGLNLFDVDEDGLYWLRWRREDSIAEGQAVRRELDKLPRRLLLGNGLRSAVFSGMTALDFAAWDEIADFLLVKHYFWHRGFDGLYGTVARWVQRLCRWNRDLSEADAFLVVENLFGLRLPGVRSLLDLEQGFPQEFFDDVVASETSRALAAAGGDADRLIFWVSTGRAPHAGDAMTSRDLHGILAAGREAGMTRFLFHPDPMISASEWRVLSSLCGTPWQEQPGGWFPGGEDPTDTYSGTRVPPTDD